MAEGVNSEPSVLRPARMRAFVALEIEPVVRARIAELVAELRHAMRDARWVPPESLHLTLRFFGYATHQTLVGLQGPLAEAAARCPAARVPLGPLGLFPERGSPRVLWLGLEVPPSIRELQEACERAAVQAGFAPERRGFRPHLTIARWSGTRHRPHLRPVDLGATRLERLVLFRSELRRAGAVYTPLAAFPLGRSPERAPSG